MKSQRFRGFFPGGIDRFPFHILSRFALTLVLFLAGCKTTPPPAPTSEFSTAAPTATAISTDVPQPTTSAETKLPTPTSMPEAPPADTPVPTQVQPPTSTPETAATRPAAPTQDSNCLDQAVFVKDVNVPDGAFFDPGETFTKIWRIQNSGTCTWDGYSLVFAGGDIMNGALENPMPVISPGEIADISVDLAAPARAGLQTGHWMFQNAAGVRFGTGLPSTGTIWVQITVDSYPSNPTPTSGGSVGGTTVSTPQSGACPIQRNSGYESQIFSLVNQARTANGLAPLTQQSQLSAAALVHSTDMACNGFVDHNGSDGTTWYQRVAAQGYANYNSARENIYVGDPAFGGDAQGAFNWWMNSQVHRDNILNPGATELGIAYVYLPGSPYGGYYTLLVARP